jgi:glucose-1-phosphate thymidylyltransferase
MKGFAGEMKAVILAAGYATRLYPLTISTPKPLLDVRGKPIIEHILGKIAELGCVGEVFVVTNNKFFSDFDEWSKKIANSKVKVVNDNTKSNDERLGSIGDICFVVEKEKIDDDLLIVNGDNLFNFSLKASYDFFKKTRKIINPLYDSKNWKTAKEQGTVVINRDGKFIEFQEKSPEPKTTLVSLGIYFFPKEKLRLIKQFIDEGNNPDKLGHLIMWLMKRETILGNIYEKKWFDIGWPESLEEARRDFEG